MSAENQNLSAEELIALAKSQDKDTVVNKLNAAAPPEGTPPPKKEHDVHSCPRCNFELRDKDGKVNEKAKADEEDVKEYVRRMISGQRYTKTYKLFDGQIEISFTTLTKSQSESLSRALNKLSLKDHMFDDIKAVGYGLKLMCSLTSVKLGNDTISYEFPTDAVEMKATYDERFGDKDEWLMVALVTSFGFFERHLGMMMGEAFDENFWTGAGLG